MTIPTFQNSQSNTKLRNESAVLLELLRHEHVSRAGLSTRTHLSATTITNIITDLLESGIVEEDQATSVRLREGVGRPRRALCLVPQARYAVGVYLGLGQVEIGITDLRAHILHLAVLDFDLDTAPANLFQRIAQQILEDLAGCQIEPGRVVGVGMGLKGLVDAASGVNIFDATLRWRDVPARDMLAQHLTLPVCVDNNVRLMALGESLFGPDHHTGSMALIYAHAGVGAGLVIDGQIYRGAHAAAGEIGHTTLLIDGGDPCHCGNSGCLETLISEPALLRAGRDIARQTGQAQLAAALEDGGADSLARLFDEARAGHAAINTMLVQRARYMGIALANLVNSFDPARVLLAGNVYTRGQDIMLLPTRAAMCEHSLGDLGTQVELAVVPPERNIAVIGAAGYALDTHFYRQGLVAL